MKTIWKYTLEPDCLSIAMPVGSKILYAREQRDQICIWALVDPEAKTETKQFEVYATGHDVPDRYGEYIGSAHIMGGTFIFHVFELGN